MNAQNQFLKFPLILLLTAIFFVSSHNHFVGPVYAQTTQAQPTAHTLRIKSQGFSLVQVEVDGTPVFRGMLLPNESRQWRGKSIVLTAQNNAPIAVTLDGILQGTLTKSERLTTFRWPTTITTPSFTSFASDTENNERPPALYTVQPGDTLFVIAEEFGTDIDTLMTANQLTDIDLIYTGTTLAIPGGDGTLPTRRTTGLSSATAPESGWEFMAVPPILRASAAERLTESARNAPSTSPFYKTTWLTYYGRPAVPVMGILGEHEIDALIPILQKEAAAYDEANGDELDVLPAFHLVYGMATKGPGIEGSHLVYLEDATVERYIQRAAEVGFAVILDIQIGALTPTESLAYGLPWLKYDNVHLALDPEFAMAHAGQVWPGDPIGFVTAAQLNEAQASMQQYMEENEIAGQRVLLVHQFLDTMIENKADLDWSYDRLALTISADGWGGPWGKISKYNLFMDEQTRYTAFKLFYRWDEPLMTPREALGIDGYGEQGYIEVTPNLIMYQ